MRKAERLFQLVNLIRARQPITAAELAARLGVSARSIYRYIDDLSVNGIPVYGEAGVGYRLDENFELPPLTLTSAELEALTLAMDMLSRAVGNDLSRAAQSLLAKIYASLPDARASDGDGAVLAFTEPFDAAHKTRWDQLRLAIAERAPLEIDYLSLALARTRRAVFPLGLLYWGGKWTLVAWCGLRGDYRSFRVDLIQALRRTVSAPPPAHASLADYLRRQQEAWRREKATDNTLSAGAF
ncbi:DNA-binding transcriptional regulator [Chromobacterium violaceum]|uniref:helix-turn-helix transcriptional regulator n=1 Tax=Chromobacterium violaceum TaxID=536 RepID=UPI0009D9A732|nr:YafY family protein [Chromobacterium violaceum]OQS10431.1 DNA-binding transcriptional regulator [Chromobacterium violaceum]OQS29883.1 DNA-binding transcriptional regulator [Chromobacterium violaceum]